MTAEQDPAEILKKRMASEARLRLSIEDSVQVPTRYATLFSGLKLNTAHNSAVMEPLVFLIRRFLYAMVIVLLGHKPQVALMLLIALSVVVLAFTVAEKPWKDSDMQTLAVANESFFFLVLVLVIGCTSTAPAHGVSKDILGWAIIIVVTLAIHVNLIVMMAKSYQHACLLAIRRKNMQAHKAEEKKVIPVNVNISVGQAPVDLKSKLEEGLNMEGI